MQISKNFTWEEFTAFDTAKKLGILNQIIDWEVRDNVIALVENLLQPLRDAWGKPITINSGYRCQKHNKNVGGAKNSRHTQGMACDIVVKGVKPKEVAKFAETIGIRGIGLYDTFVHIDSRESKFYWKGHEQKSVKTFK